MMVDLRQDEVTLIQTLRKAARYSTIRVEKRPTKSHSDGELVRVVIEQSYLMEELKDIPVHSPGA